MGYYNECTELTLCRALDRKYWETEEFEKWTQGYIKIANETGYPLAFCQVGYAYLEGIGVEKDLKAAFEWTQKGANLGDRDAQYNMGYMYEHGLFVEKDRSKAFEWYRRAAQQEQNLAIEKCQENWN
jgi:hypothetical protein